METPPREVPVEREAVEREPAPEEARPPFSRWSHHLSLMGGYGFGLPIGASADSDLEDTQYAAVIPRWGIGLTNPLGRDDAWYRGNLELLLEGAFLFQHEPRNGFAGGGGFMLRWNFLRLGRFVPFAEIGAGLIDLDFDFDEQSDGLNFTPQGGFGLHWFATERLAITGGWRLHHISNAGTKDENDGINSSLFLLGVSFYLR